MKRLLERSAMIAILIAAGSGVAVAQTHAARQAATPMARGMRNGGMMQNRGMMNMMMGNDPVGSCASMMNAIAKDPVLRKRLNALMMREMQGHNGRMQPMPSATPH